MHETALFAAICALSATTLCALPGHGATGAAFPAIDSDSGVRGGATGFFHAENIGGADWVVDPEGRALVVKAVDHVRPGGWIDRNLGYDIYKRFCETNYPSVEAWADETVGRLRSWGFNTLASQCNEPKLRRRGMAHTLTLYLGGMFARWNGGDPDRWITPWSGPCTGMPNVFHPDFEAEIRKAAREACAPERDDPWLLGWFLDNELKWWGAPVTRQDLGLVDAIRRLPPGHSARKALEEYEGKFNAENDALREGFLKLVAERYFSVLCGAIRDADPNHMILGCRFMGPFGNVNGVVWETAGKYCDIVSMNVYPWADIDKGTVLDAKGGKPVAGLFRDIHAKCGRPLMVTEWGFPALDAGRPCHYGAGQRFRTQAERAEASALFARTMLSLPFFAGHSFFMFVDQPASGISESFREDSNYGLVSELGVPYREVTEALSGVQRDAARWKGGPVPGEDGTQRAFALPDAESGPSERERYFAEVAASPSRLTPDSARDAASPLPSLEIDAEGKWTLGNGLVWLAGRKGGENAADAVELAPCGRVGSLRLLVQWLRRGASVWTFATNVTAVREDTWTPDGFRSLVLEIEGADDSAKFSIGARLTLGAGLASALVEVLSVKNLGTGPLELLGVHVQPFPDDAEPQPDAVVPQLWEGPSEAWWRIPGRDGAWGLLSHDSAARFRFFFRHEDKSAHPDGKFSVGADPVAIPPKGVWLPAGPMGAQLGLRNP